MKRYIYTTLFVFATLFCQAFGGQNEPFPTTTICAKIGDTVRMIDYKDSIQKLLEIKEKAIWSGSCDEVVVDVQGAIHSKGESITLDKWPAVIVRKDAELTIEVTYKRHLRCTNIPQREKDAKPGTSLAMWYLFGKLLSETDTDTTAKISDTAFISTIHKVKLTYRFGVSFPDDIKFKILGDSCFGETFSSTLLNVPDGYSSCRLKWFKPENVGFTDEYNDTMNRVRLYPKDDSYLFPIVCMAISCTGDTVSDTIKIGKPTPTPKMDNLACVAANETSFTVAVKEPDSRLSYHWTVENLAGNEIIDTQQGASVTMNIPQKEAVKLKLISTGGCRASDAVTQILHRSVVAGNIQLQGDTNCLFIGDILHFVLQNAPQDSLVWKSETEVVTLMGNAEFICNTAGLNTTSFKVSVSNKNCPESVDSNTFNIREDFKISIEPRDSCINAHTDYVFKVAGNVINPSVEWYGYGVNIESGVYKKEDSIRLQLSNSGEKNPYVILKANECGKESKDSLVLHSKPEIPQLDTLWNNCIPLGIDTSIELWVQPQEGATFVWDFFEDEKFHRVAESDSPFIRVATNYALFDADRNIPIMVNVHAKRDGCAGDTKTEYLSVFGAGLSEEWKIGSKNQKFGSFDMLTIGFYQEEETEIKTHHEELDPFTFSWKCNITHNGSKTSQTLQFRNNKIFSFDVNCLLTNKNTSCYSYYNATIEDKTLASQSMIPSPSNSIGFGETDGASDMAYTNIVRTEDNLIDGIVLAPNPTQGNTLLYLGNINIEKQTVIEIFTEQSVCMYHQTTSANIVDLPTARYRSGLYFVRVRTGEEEPVVKKLIVK